MKSSQEISRPALTPTRSSVPMPGVAGRLRMLTLTRGELGRGARLIEVADSCLRAGGALGAGAGADAVGLISVGRDEAAEDLAALGA